MTKMDISFVPHNDMSPKDVDIVGQHKNLIEQNKFSDATTLLNDSEYSKGARASFFNSVEEKLKIVMVHILNKTADPDEYYSINEPTEKEMEGKSYWIKPY